MMALSEKIKEIFGLFAGTLDPEDEYGDAGDSDELTPEYLTDRNAALAPVLSERSSMSKRNNLRVLPQRQNAYEVVVIEPKAYNESIKIVDALKERKTVILNLQLLDRDQSQRIVDFLCGCTHALEGSQRKIGENVFIFTPPNINITQEILNSKLSSDAIWTKA
ncbi:cell division protein SepF [bacterium]|nr:cell division protein SepF [bacterium]